MTRIPGPEAFSLVRSGVLVRLAAALAGCGLVWLAIVWAMT